MFITFTVIAFSGFGILCFSIVFGGDHEFDTSADIHVDGDIDGHGFGRFMSIKLIASFATAFGAGGATASGYGLPGWVCVLTGLVCGILLVMVSGYIINLFKKNQSNSAYTISSLKNSFGIVTLRIPEDGTGEIQVSCGGFYRSLSARSENRTAIKQGTHVVIVETTDPVLVRVKGS